MSSRRKASVSRARGQRPRTSVRARISSVGSRFGRRRIVLTALTVLLVLMVGVPSLCYAVLSMRIRHVHVSMHHSPAGQTWVLIGSDSRSDLPSGPNVYGNSAQVPGARADIVLLLHVENGHSSLVSVPRDLLVNPRPGLPDRLALAYAKKPQFLVDGICRTLGVSADHLVAIDMGAFAAVVDAVGGLDVSIRYPVRDGYSGLSIGRTGTVHLPGRQALALVRSRHGEQLISGTWTAESTSVGSLERATWAASVFSALSAKVREAKSRPVSAMRVAWAATSGLTTDSDTGLWTLLHAKLDHVVPTELPVTPVANGIAFRADDATFAALSAAGMPRSCD